MTGSPTGKVCISTSYYMFNYTKSIFKTKDVLYAIVEFNTHNPDMVDDTVHTIMLNLMVLNYKELY